MAIRIIDPPCYETHKPIRLHDTLISGGSALYPPPNCSTNVVLGAQPFRPEGPCNVFKLYIPDVGVPESVSDFNNLIDKLMVQIQTGVPKIHIGCTAGHGRTGMVLTALFARYLGESEKILLFTRLVYCYRAVENETQEDWLRHNYNIT